MTSMPASVEYLQPTRNRVPVGAGWTDGVGWGGADVNPRPIFPAKGLCQWALMGNCSASGAVVSTSSGSPCVGCGGRSKAASITSST